MGVICQSLEGIMLLAECKNITTAVQPTYICQAVKMFIFPHSMDILEHPLLKPGVGSVVRVAAWDPRVLSSSPVGR